MIYTFFPYASNAISLLFVINFIIACIIIFLERKDPSSTLAWIMILFLVPFAGIPLYFLFSQNLSRKKIFNYKALEQRILETSLRTQIEELDSNALKFNQTEIKKYKDKIHLHQVHSHALFSQDNTINIFTTGKEKFHSLLKDIRQAETSIHVMYFIFQNDSLGKEILQALTEKAREGVEVRLLLDAMGSKRITTRVLREYSKAGGKHAYFFPSKLKLFNLKLNYRNHRKLVVIDGKIGYIGGFNVGNEYLGKKRMGYWRDTHIKITGSAVYDMQARFILDWRSASKEDLDIALGYYCEPISVGECGIQIVSSGPDSIHEQIKMGYLKMISSAKESIFIQTPYFVPDDSIQEALKMACLSGIDVRIMIPCRPDHAFVYWATYSYVGELLEAGAKIYIYQNGFLHAKTICIDGAVASIGTANFDIRSFRLNFEVNAFIYDTKTVSNLETIFINDIDLSINLTKELYMKRSLLIRFKESISRLLSNLL